MAEKVDYITEMANIQKQIVLITNLLDGFFKDKRKVEAFLNQENEWLGNRSPLDMIFCGRFEKLHSFVKSMLEENERENL